MWNLKPQKTWKKKKKPNKKTPKIQTQWQKQNPKKKRERELKKKRRKLTSALPRAFDDGGNGLGSRWMWAEVLASGFTGAVELG